MGFDSVTREAAVWPSSEILPDLPWGRPEATHNHLTFKQKSQKSGMYSVTAALRFLDTQREQPSFFISHTQLCAWGLANSNSL